MDNIWLQNSLTMIGYQGRFTSSLLTLSSLDHLEAGPPIFHLGHNSPINSDFYIGSFLDHIFDDKKEVWAEFGFPFLSHPLLC